jgi:ABC-type transport system involved in multi-copper enzyme maturation permease subunit
MNQVLVIGQNVFRQLLRNRILSVLFLFALSLTAVVTFLADLGAEAETRLSRDFGLLAVEWIGFFTVLLCHVVLLFEETELKTISILLVRPIRRWQVMAGKLAGSVFLLALNQAGMLLVLWATGKIRGLTLVDFPFVLASLFLFLELCLFSVVVSFFGIYASTVPSCAVYSAFTFALGHFTGNLVEWVQTMNRPALALPVKALYYLVPNLGLFDLKDVLLNAGQALTPGTFLWPLAYGLLYGGALLSLSTWLYDKKEY